MVKIMNSDKYVREVVLVSLGIIVCALIIWWLG